MGNFLRLLTSYPQNSSSTETSNSQVSTLHECRLKIKAEYIILIIEYFLRNCKLFYKSSKDVIKLISLFAYEKRKVQLNNYTEYDYLLKIVLMGDSGVGKSSFLRRYATNEFTYSYLATIGVDFEIVTKFYQNSVYKFQIWDTAGRERFRNITTSYYRNAHIICVFYDMTYKQSFNNVRHWVNEIDEKTQSQVVKVIVFGTKCDLVNETIITKSEAIKFCNELNNYNEINVYFGGETSSKMGYGFENMTQILLDIYTSQFDKCKYCNQILNYNSGKFKSNN